MSVKRRTKTAGAVRAAASAAIALEKLELRRLLSGGDQLDQTIIDSDGGYAYENFGRAIATQGTLALIGSTGEATSITHDGGNTYEDIDTTSGRVSLVDTTTGNILQTFHNPIPDAPTGTQFGAAVAFVDGKI